MTGPGQPPNKLPAATLERKPTRARPPALPTEFLVKLTFAGGLFSEHAILCTQTRSVHCEHRYSWWPRLVAIISSAPWHGNFRVMLVRTTMFHWAPPCSSCRYLAALSCRVCVYVCAKSSRPIWATSLGTSRRVSSIPHVARRSQLAECQETVVKVGVQHVESMWCGWRVDYCNALM